MAQQIMNPRAIQEKQGDVGREDSLEEYSCLENPMDRGAWWAMVLGFAESQTRLRADKDGHTRYDMNT